MAGTFLPSTGPVSASDIKTQYGSSATPVNLNEFYRVDTTSIPQSTATTAGTCDLNPQDLFGLFFIPSSGEISLGDFRGTGARFVDQSDIQDVFYKRDFLAFDAAVKPGDATTIGCVGFGVSTGGTSYGTPVQNSLNGQYMTFKNPEQIRLTATNFNNSGGIFYTDTGPDAPYIYMFVSPASHPDSSQIISSTFQQTWNGLCLREYNTSDVYQNDRIYLRQSDAVEMNNADDLYGWYWDNTSVNSSDIEAGKRYYGYLAQAGF